MAEMATSSAGPTTTHYDARQRYSAIRRKMAHATQQVALLTDQLEALQRRYERAERDGRRTFRYGLALRRTTTEGARNMFAEYARRCHDALEGMRCACGQCAIAEWPWGGRGHIDVTAV